MKRCLLISFVVIILLFLNCSNRQKISFLNKQDVRIVGTWQTIKGDSEYVCFDLEMSGESYRTYLHDHIFLSGIWIKTNEKMMIIDNIRTNVYFKIVFSNNTMTLSNINGSVEMYKRYED